MLMADGYTRELCRWLLQVAEDATLPDSCCRLANVLALKFMNRTKGYAWPTVPTLAKTVGFTTRAVTNQIRRLVEAGHLQVDHDRGRGHSNAYRWLLKHGDNRPSAKVLENGNRGSGKANVKEEFQFEETGTAASPKPEPAFRKTRTEVPTEPSEEPREKPTEEPFEGAPTKKTSRRSGIRDGKKRTSIPNDYTASAAHLEFAHAHGWDSSRAREEFEKFSDHHRARGNAFADWLAAWRTWVRNGIKFDSGRLQRGKTRGNAQTVVDGALSYAKGRNQDD
jgi:hypothetical protein